MDEQMLKGIPKFLIKIIGSNDHKGFFAFTQFAKPATFLHETDENKRCDYNAPRIARGFHHWNAETNLCSCGSPDEPNRLTGGHWTFDEMTALFPVLDAYPAGMIVYMELEWSPEREAMEAQNFHKNRATNLTRTLQEQFRLLIEWEYAHKYLGNDEEMAVCATEILEVLDLPPSIRQWILDNVPNEKVNRFLEGRIDAQQRADIETIPNLTDEFKEWIVTKFRQTKSFGEHGVEL